MDTPHHLPSPLRTPVTASILFGTYCDGCGLVERPGSRYSTCPVCKDKYCEDCYTDPDRHRCQALPEPGLVDL